MNPNIREVLFYEGVDDDWVVRHDVRVGDVKVYRIRAIPPDGLHMTNLEKIRIDSEFNLIYQLKKKDLSIDDATPIPMPQGLPNPRWYIPP